MGAGERSLEAIEPVDLCRLAAIACADREAFFARNPRWRVYGERVLCVTLCQGAALHYLDGRNGVKDFDVWTFYAEHEVGRFPPRRRGTADFGESRFGRYPPDPPAYTGRRIDLYGRSLPVGPDADPVESVRACLEAGRTRSARELALKAVALLEPGARLGERVWPA